MAVRQYIGARYVPRFSDVNAGVWDDSYTYEPLTIVKHGNDYYTSKKEVPTGIAITNTEYWILTGNYNGAITELQGEIDDINDDLSVLKNERNTIVLIGDSWFANVASIPEYIQNHFGCTVKNYSVGGSGFNVEGGYKDQLDVMAADSTLDLDDVRFCMINAGLNDHARGATAQQFATMFNEWKVKYNGIFAGHQIPPVYWSHSYSLENELNPSIEGSNPTTYTTQFVYFRNVSRSIHQIRSINSFALLPGTSDAWQTDNWRHPNTAGGIAFAENLCRAIDGVPVVHYVYQDISGTIDSSVVPSGNSINAKFYIRDNEMICKLNAAVAALSATPTGAGMLATFEKYFPVTVDSNQDFDCGVKVGSFTYANKTLSLQPDASEIRTKYADGTGRTIKEFTCSALT